MSIVTDNTKTLANALERIATLEAEKAHLLTVIRGRKLAGYVNKNGSFDPYPDFPGKWKPVYYISDEYDAAGILIQPEVKIE